MSKVIGMLDWARTQKKRIYKLNEGSAAEKSVLGYKGANLCEMYRLGLPVPPAFIVSTETCNDFFHAKCTLSADFIDELKHGIHGLEKRTNKKFQASAIPDQFPLLLSVRSGAAVAMPGMTETILNLGINDQLVDAMARTSENPRWAYDCYARFLQMFGTVVMKVNPERYEDVLREARAKRNVTGNSMLDVLELKDVVGCFKLLADVPTDPWEQLTMAVEAVFNSWYSPEAVRYRDINNISSDIGTAVVVQNMVYGNFNALSGSGVGSTRDAHTGAKVFNGKFLPNSAGEEVNAGQRHAMSMADLVNQMPELHKNLEEMQDKLETHFRDMQDYEFTVENSQLFFLETRAGKRSAAAAVRIAVSMVDEKLVSEREAMLRLDAKQMEFFLHPMVDPETAKIDAIETVQRIICTGIAASAGAAVGKVAFTSEDVQAFAQNNEVAILIKYDTNCSEDISGLVAAAGCVTLKGGSTSHAAVVMRSMGKPCVTNARGLSIDALSGSININGSDTPLKKGDVITVDGLTGNVYRGELPLIVSDRDEYFMQVMQWANKYKRLHVFASTRTQKDVDLAHRMGADGVGLCRTEHMFFKEHSADLFRRVLLADTADERKVLLSEMIPYHQQEFLAMYEVFHSRQTIVRLLDRPLSDFLPNPQSEDYESAVLAIATRLQFQPEKVFARIVELQESNPTLGTRGVRMSVLYPEITDMQTRAVVGAALEMRKQNIMVKPKLMLPMVCTDHEIDMITPIISHACDEVCAGAWADSNYNTPYLECSIGSMVDVPRACLRADRIAGCKNVNFLSIGTNDLTQLVFGFSREDTYHYMPEYLKNHLVAKDPFVSIDLAAVGDLVDTTVKLSKKANHSVKVGVCGDHGGDPASVEFFEHIGLDYVTCSPYKVPIAKIAAAQAHIKHTIHHSRIRAAFGRMF